jgi:hypothetical protein
MLLKAQRKHSMRVSAALSMFLYSFSGLKRYALTITKNAPVHGLANASTSQAQALEASGRASPGALRASLSVALDFSKAAGLANHSLRLAGRRPAFFDELLGEISNLSGCFSAENNGTAAGVAGRSGLVGVHEEGALTRLKAVRRNRC